MRLKKKLQQARELFDKATPPRDGDGVWDRAVSALREAVAENLPYRTELEVYSEGIGEPPGITIYVPIALSLPIIRDPARARFPLYVDGRMPFQLDIRADLAPQLQRVMDHTDNIARLSSLARYLVDQVDEDKMTETEAAAAMFAPSVVALLSPPMARLGVEAPASEGVTG